jgi:hypothetical protein
VKIKFIQNNAAAFGLAYVRGEEADLGIPQAMTLIEAGIAVAIEEPVEKESDLPENFPHRAKLVAADISLLEVMLADEEKLLKIQGIGKKAAADILEFISNEENFPE